MLAMNQWFKHSYTHQAFPSYTVGWRLLFASTLVLLFLLLPRQSFAADRCAYIAGNDPTHPFLPIDAWIALQDGDQHWYAFRDEGDSTAITVRMSLIPENSASFRILTPAQMNAWQQGEPVEAVGASTALSLLHDDQFWTGSFVQSGIYYVLVESHDRGLSNYMLSIQGSAVSFPLFSFAKVYPPIAEHVEACLAMSTPPPPPTIEETATPSALISSPEDPLPPIGRALPIQSGEWHWYAFRDEGDDGTIAIRATADPGHCITFALWTPAELALWRQNEEFRPVGQGTINEQFNGDLFWTGSFVKSGIYYVVAERDPVSAGACSYQLRVTGDDVSLVMLPRNQ